MKRKREPEADAWTKNWCMQYDQLMVRVAAERDPHAELLHAAHPTYGSVAPAHSSYCPGGTGVDPVPNHEIRGKWSRRQGAGGRHS